MTQFRRLVTAHRDAAQLLRERPPVGPHRRRHIETTLGILSQAGFAGAEQLAIAELLAAHVLNSVPRCSAGLSDQARFELGSDIIPAGLIARAGQGCHGTVSIARGSNQP